MAPVRYANGRGRPARQQFHLSHMGRNLEEECQFVTRYYPAERVIFHQGHSEPRAFLIQSGWGRLYRDILDGQRQIVEIPMAGDFVGLLYDFGVQNESFSSITPLVVWEGHSASLRRWAAGPSPASEYFHMALARQRTVMMEHLADLGKRSAAVRMVHFFLEMGERVASVRQGSSKSFACPLTQNDLSDLLGLTSIYVNRILREVRERNLLVFRQGRVEFLDYDAAMKFAVFDKDYCF
jgi:CRP-like cAMP-binding protein